jgi:siroheme synthase (precorrin-2 oxidase/ferrochelatase)
LLVDLILDGRQTLVVGQGMEPEFKAVKLLDAKAVVTVLGESFTPGLQRIALRKPGRVSLVSARPTVEAVLKKVDEIRPVVVFISTGDIELDERLSDGIRRRRREEGETRTRRDKKKNQEKLRARSDGATSAPPIICVVDEPWLNDFNMPALARRGDIRVGVSTGGKSPAMAAVLRRKIEGIITQEDVLQVKLQGYIRQASKRRLRDAASRKEFAYKVIDDKKIGALLRKDDYAAAREHAEKMLREEEEEKEGESRSDDKPRSIGRARAPANG